MRALALPVIVVLASSAGWVAGGAFFGLGAMRGAVIAGVIALMTGLSAAIHPRGTASGTWRRIEFLILVLVTVGAVSVGGGRTAARVAAALLLALTIRSLVAATSADLAMMDRVADDRPIGAPPDRLRLRVLGFGVLLTTIAAYASATDAGLSDLSRRAVGGQFWAVAIWFGFGIVGVGLVSLHARRAAWKRNGVTVDHSVGQRWIAGVVGTALVVLGVIVATPIVSGQLTAVPAQAISRTDGLDRLVTNMLSLFERDGGAGDGESQTVDREPRDAIGSDLETDLADRPAWVGEAMLTAIIATIFLWAIRLGRGVRFSRTQVVGPGGVWIAVRALASDFVAGLARMVAGLVAWFRGLGRGEKGRSEPTVRFGRSPSEWQRARWTPRGALEQRIARAFANLVRTEKAEAGETPTEVAVRIGDRTDHRASGVVLSGYLDARYSSTEVSPEQADDVERALERIQQLQQSHPQTDERP